MSDKNENICCGIIEQLAEKFDLPFEKPICFEEGELAVKDWGIRLNKLTPARNLSSASGNVRVIMINYCPFCGKELMESRGKKWKVEDIESMIDYRDTPLISKLGLDGARTKDLYAIQRNTGGGWKIIGIDNGDVINHSTIFQKAIRSELHVGEEFENEFMFQARKAIPHLLRLVERMVFYSERLDGSRVSPCQSGGLRTFVTRNVVKAQGELNGEHITRVMDMIDKEGGFPDWLVMNPRTAIDLRRNIGGGDHVVPEMINIGLNEFELIADRWCPTDTAYVLNSEKVGFYTLRPFESYELASSGGSMKGEVVGEFSLLVEDGDIGHGKIIEITT